MAPMENSHSEEHEKAMQLASSVLGYMKKRGLPTNPNNFLVWYEYFSTTNPDLEQALKPLLENNGSISDQDSAEIHSMFFSEPGSFEDIKTWTDGLVAVVGDMSAALVDADCGAQTYESSLRLFCGGIGSAQDVTAIAPMVDLMTSDTQLMAARIRELEAQVMASGEQVARLTEELGPARDGSMTDGLTGTANRHCFDLALAKEMKAAQQSGEPLALILCEFDQFQAISKAYGRTALDQALRIVARELTDGIKGQDVAARFSGEEFAVIVPNTPLEGAAALANNLRCAVSGQKFNPPGSEETVQPLTLSLGVTVCVSGEAMAAFVDRADRALFGAKRAGRNRVATLKGEKPRQAARA